VTPYHPTTWPDVAIRIVDQAPQIAQAIGMVLAGIGGMIAAVMGVLNRAGINKGNVQKDAIAKDVKEIKVQTNGLTDKLVVAGTAAGNLAGRAEEKAEEHDRETVRIDALKAMKE
jgi:hypothetical protein